MEKEEKNPYLFYLIIALIVLGFIASLAFPLNAREHKLRDASYLNAGANVAPSAPSVPSPTEAAVKRDHSLKSSTPRFGGGLSASHRGGDAMMGHLGTHLVGPRSPLRE
jgi:hypothetical protein